MLNPISKLAFDSPDSMCDGYGSLCVLSVAVTLNLCVLHRLGARGVSETHPDGCCSGEMTRTEQKCGN